MKKFSVKKIPSMLVLGFGAFIVGIILLAVTLGSLPTIGAFWPVFLIGAGLFFLNIGYFVEAQSHHIFVGYVSLLCGIIALLDNTLLSMVTVEQIWPIYMGIAGISLVPYAFTFNSTNTRISLLTPSIVLILMAIVFIPFSFDLVEMSFGVFVSRWWPLLLIVFGTTITIAYYLREMSHRKHEPEK